MLQFTFERHSLYHRVRGIGLFDFSRSLDSGQYSEEGGGSFFRIRAEDRPSISTSVFTQPDN